MIAPMLAKLAFLKATQKGPADGGGGAPDQELGPPQAQAQVPQQQPQRDQPLPEQPEPVVAGGSTELPSFMMPRQPMAPGRQRPQPEEDDALLRQLMAGRR